MVLRVSSAALLLVLLIARIAERIYCDPAGADGWGYPSIPLAGDG